MKITQYNKIANIISCNGNKYQVSWFQTDDCKPIQYICYVADKAYYITKFIYEKLK
jgi:hypothetical protein